MLCNRCKLNIQPLSTLSLQITEKKKIDVITLGKYDGILKKMILKKLYSNETAMHDLGLLLQSSLIITFPFDYIVPIPLHWTRKLYRGFNQSEIFAKYISDQYQKPVVNALIKVKMTKYQSRLKLNQRNENIKNAFKIKNKYKKLLYKKNILIIDDVCTTGSTLKEASLTLFTYKPLSINALVIART